MRPSACAVKLREYLDKNGIRHVFAAECLGISRSTLSDYLNGRRPLPKKALDKLVIFTKGKISKKELLSEFFKDGEEDES